jgi:hypothetical protein
VPGAQIHEKAELRLHVVVQRFASAKGAQKGADSCEMRQYHFRLLIQLGEGILRVRMVKDEVASRTLFDTPPVGE